MVLTLSFTPKEAKDIVKALQEYPSLPSPSAYELARHKVGEANVTVYTSGKIVVQGKSALVEEAVEEKIIQWMGSAHDELVLGIDETGRGENTGPLVIGGVVGQRNALRKLRDSKKTSDITKAYAHATKDSLMNMSISFNAETIDTLRGKGFTLNTIEAEAMKKMHELAQVFFPQSITIADGRPLQKGMKGIVFQEKADDIEPSVGAASIIAKHTRNESGDHATRKSWKTKEKD